MSQSEDRTQQESKFKNILREINPKYYTIDKKLMVILTLVSLFSIFVISSIGFYVSKKDARESALNHLRSIREAKKMYIEDYFDLLYRQVSMLSKDQLVVNSVIEFRSAFETIEYDNYLTTEVKGMRDIEDKLTAYYQNNFVSKVNHNLGMDFDVESLIPADNKAKIVQFHYIADNGRQEGKKHSLDKSKDGSMYSFVHSEYNPKLRKYASDFDFDDIILINHVSGEIVYTLKKGYELGCDLINGIYRNTNLARVFKKSIVGSDNFVTLSDYELFIPSLGKPAIYMAAPIYSNGLKMGVLAVKIPNQKIHEILTSSGNWERQGLGETGQIFLVGDDFKLRSDTRELIENKEQFLLDIRKADIEEENIRHIERLNTNILLQDIKYSTVQKTFKGRSAEDIIVDFKGDKMISSVTRLDIEGLNWAVVGQTSLKETYKSFHKLEYIILISSIIFILFSIYFGHIIAKTFSARITSIRNALIALTKGESFKKIKDNSFDEISETVKALKQLSERINNASYFAQAIGGGNYAATFEPESENDKFGVSLTQMKDSLVAVKQEEEKRKVEDEIRNWITNGIAKFSELLRQNNDDIEKLSYTIIRELIEYVNGNIAGMFILNDDNEQDKFFELRAAYAYDRKKFLEKRINFGEGLVGTCAVEKQSIFIKEIPEEYADISSGIGHSNPRSLFLVPLKVEETVYGIIEIGSITEFKEHEREFIVRLAESIAATLVTVRLNVKTKKLLKESEERANEIRQQEEEMRQNLEEMMATQEELERVRKDEQQKVRELTELLDGHKKLMTNVLNRLPGTVTIKDARGIIEFANEEAAKTAYVELEELIGKTGYEDLSREESRKALKAEKEIIESGFRIAWDERETENEKRYYKILKLPINLAYKKEKGLFIWEMDYSELRLKGQEAIKDELGEFKEKLKNTMKDLKDYQSRFGDLPKK